MLETKEQNQIEQSVWTTLFTRWKSLVSAQPQVFGLILVCAVWALIGLPGLGQNGLWDPWEMDRAHVARQMTGSPSVLVVEDTENAAELGPIGQWLVLRYGDMLHVSVPEKGPGKGVTQKLEKAVKKLDNAVYQLVILDVSTVVEDPRAQAQVEQLIGWVERVESRNPGTEVLCLVPLPAEDDPNGLNAQDYRDALARTWSVARIELAARELSGRQWGRPGPFRSALIRELKSAESASPLTSLLALNNGGTSFLERGFWRAAEKRKLTDRLQRQVSADVVNALVDKDEFKFQAPVVSWPVGKDYAAVVEGFATGESVARQAAVDAVTEFETRVDQITPVPWWRAQFKKGGITYSRPPLDYWLIGLSFNAFGQSEFAARFPGFALGFLTLILLFRFTMRAFNPATATWSCLVLATSPLFFAQARSASSELSFVLALLCCLGGLSTMRELRFRSRDLFLVVIGCALAFLAQGMFGIVVVLCTMVTFAFLNNNGPRSMWAVVLAVAISTAAFSMWLSDQTQWTFWSHFGFDAPLQHWKLGATDRPFNLNFDVLIRQIGFGTAPWIGLIPFGIARLVGDGVGSKKPAAMMVLLWAIVPYFVQSLILKDNNHFVYAATPALAVAVGYLLHSVYATRSLGTLAAAAAAIAVGLIVGNITKSPEPLTSFLTVDPPLGSGKGAEVYPETLKVALALKMMLVSILVMLVLGPARFGARLRHIVSFFRRPVPFWIFATVALVALSVYVLAGLEYQLASSFATKAGRLLEPIHRVFVRSVFYWRPQSLALMFGAGAMLLLLVWYHTTLWHRVTGWIKTWVLTSMTAYAVGMALSLVALGMGISTHVSPLEAIAELPVLAIAILAATIGTSVAISNVRSGFSPMPLVVLFSASWLLYPVAGGSWLVAAGSLLVAGLGLAVGRFSKLPDYMTPVALGSVAGSLVMAVAAPESSDVLAVIQFIVCFACLTAGLLSCSGGIHRLKQATNDSVVLAPLGQPLAAMRALSTLLPLALVVLAVAFDSQFATALPMTVLAVLALFSASLPLGHHVGQFSDLTVRLIALVSIAVAVVLTLVWQT